MEGGGGEGGQGTEFNPGQVIISYAIGQVTKGNDQTAVDRKVGIGGIGRRGGGGGGRERESEAVCSFDGGPGDRPEGGEKAAIPVGLAMETPSALKLSV